MKDWKNSLGSDTKIIRARILSIRGRFRSPLRSAKESLVGLVRMGISAGS